MGGATAPKHWIATTCATLLLAISPEARAADIGPIEAHGFVSPGFIVTTDNNYLAKSKRGSAEFAEVGINFTVPLTDRLRAGLQLFARDLGPIGDYAPRVDWFYLDYRVEDWLGFRAGRIKQPFGLFNEVSDIDAARVPVLLPQVLYPIQSRDFFLAQTGAEIYGRVNMRALGAFEYRLWAGTIFIDTRNVSSVSTTVREIDVPFVAGERLMWETPLEGLRVGGTLLATKLDFALLNQGLPFALDYPTKVWITSVEYNAHDWQIAAEYGGQYSRISIDPPIAPPEEIRSEGMYVMVSRRITPWFQPGAYYALGYANVEDRDGPDGSQHDIAGTLRFDINNHWLVKLEGHYMNGTAILNPALNDGQPLDTLERSWGVFLFKTTAYF